MKKTNQQPALNFDKLIPSGSKALDAVHILFLLTSAVHNGWNVFTHESGLLALFGLAGILAVELTLWGAYTGWQSSQFIGPQKRRAVAACSVAWLYATVGLVASAGGLATLESVYFMYFMPTAAPVMFVLVWRVIAANPERLAEEESLMEEIAAKLYRVQDAKLVRQLNENTRSRDHTALMKQAGAIRTGFRLKSKAKVEYGQLLSDFSLTNNQHLPASSVPELEVSTGDGMPAKKPGSGGMINKH